MGNFSGERDFEHGRARKIGVLLVNLGTPEAPTAKAVRRYLAEFLSDRRVVEIPRLLWLAILHGIILRTRPRRSAAAYAKIWSAEGSPLMVYSERQTASLADSLRADKSGSLELVLAMRYGAPSIAAGLRRLRAANARKILVLPTYPQYAGATTASVFDAVAAELSSWRWIPDLRFISEYHAHPSYIDALAESLESYWAKHGRSERLLVSFHGTPRRSLEAGDPYHCQCFATARLLAERLGLDDDFWCVAFQSRFGRAEWLKPYTATTLQNLAREGVKTVDVICPGFAADCLETLEEIAIQYAEVFREAGGEKLSYVPALNDRSSHIAALATLVRENIMNWEGPEIGADEQARRAVIERVAALRAAAD